jgi:hypothetical protein
MKESLRQIDLVLGANAELRALAMWLVKAGFGAQRFLAGEQPFGNRYLELERERLRVHFTLDRSVWSLELSGANFAGRYAAYTWQSCLDPAGVDLDPAALPALMEQAAFVRSRLEDLDRAAVDPSIEECLKRRQLAHVSRSLGPSELIASLEGEVASIVEAVLRETDFGKPGLKPVVRGFRSHGEGRAYFSEFTIDFFQDDNLIDVLEFIVFRDGQAQFRSHELVSWLKRVLAEVINRNEGDLHWSHHDDQI